MHVGGGAGLGLDYDSKNQTNQTVAKFIRKLYRGGSGMAQCWDHSPPAKWSMFNTPTENQLLIGIEEPYENQQVLMSLLP